MDRELAVAGKPLARIDGVEKATGRAVYGQDLRRPGMLVGKVLWSEHSHARILSIDTSRAEAMPGVKAVVTRQDLPGVLHGQYVKDETILASDRVRYLGEAVAAVAAVDASTAEEAVQAIHVEYEDLPAVFDPLEAMGEGAPILHPNLDTYQSLPGKVVKGTGNICSRTSVSKGDVEEGFRQADYVFEDTFRTQMVFHSYLEPHAALAEVDERGRITVWVTTQGPFAIRALLAEVFRVPMSLIRVIATRCGGGFGGKTQSLAAPICVLLARKCRRPVKLALRSIFIIT